MLWLTISNALDKSINTPNVYLFSLKESYILFTSSIIIGHVRLNDLL